MTALTGVLDANVVIGLAKGGVFDLLSSLYGTLYVPRSVREEIVGPGQGLAGEQELLRALGVWITEVIPDPQTVQQFSATLSWADREVLAIAETNAVDHILSGDRGAAPGAPGHGHRHAGDGPHPDVPRPSPPPPIELGSKRCFE